MPSVPSDLLFLPGPFASAFPPDVSFVCGAERPGEPPMPHPAEWALLGPRAAPRRVREFALGRACARAALGALNGVPDSGASGPILRAEGRAPRWPEGVVGAISHVPGLAAAAVGPRQRYGGLGVDLERVRAVGSRMEARLLRPEERVWTRGVAGADRAARFTLLFSVKESIYKALFPLTGVFLGFQDASVAFPSPPEGEAAGVFRWRLPEGGGAGFPAGYEAEGRYACAGGVVLTAVWVGSPAGLP